MTAKECHDLAKTGFRDGEREVHVALGTLDNPHHAFCYRLFNLQRERKAHTYQVEAPNFPEDPTPWKNVQQAASLLLDPSPATPPASNQDNAPEGEEPPARPEPSLDPSEAEDAPAERPSRPPPAADPSSAPPPSSSTTSTAGCSMAAGSLTSSHGWLLVLAALVPLVRRRDRSL